MNGRSLDQNLAFDKEAREYTKKVYKKSFEKKKSIDLKNEKRPDDSSTAKAKESSQKWFDVIILIIREYLFVILCLYSHKLILNVEFIFL